MSEETNFSLKDQFKYTVATEKRDRAAVAIDYETFYDSKAGYSLTKMPVLHYCTDPRFDAYLVAICGWEIADDGIFEDDWEEGKVVTRRRDDKSIYRKLADGRQLYIGRPEKFDGWDNLKGRILLAHNAGFDSVVTDVLARKGVLPAFLLENEWNCTADMSVYLAAPRNLKGAMEVLEGKVISKEVRAGMDGRTVYSLNDEDLAALYEYGGSDAVECHDLWLHYAKDWPLLERAISRQKRESIKRGVRINVEYAKKAQKELSSALLRAEAQIPWCPETSAQSSTALKKQLLADGYTLPKSFAKKSAEYMKWVEKNGTIPYVKARQDYSSINMHAKRIDNILNTVDENGRLHPPFKYFGAHTGRDTGNAKEDETSKESSPAVNMLNMAKKPILKGNPEVFGGDGVDIRGMFIPDPGYVFAIYDYSQIEARAVLWEAGDTEAFDDMRKEGNLYQARAVAMGWSKPGENLKKNDPDKYQLAKQCLTAETLVLVRSEKYPGGPLTKPYYKSIICVKTSDWVWDGAGWVHHAGVVKTKEVSEDEVVEVGGVALTVDHRVYVGEEVTRESHELLGCCEAAAMAWGAAANPLQGWAHVRALASALARALAGALGLAVWEALRLPPRPVRMHGVRGGDDSSVGQREKRKDYAVPELRVQGSEGDVRKGSVGEEAR